jgi:O-antigen/teichoic acid export membrane protein
MLSTPTELPDIAHQRQQRGNRQLLVARISFFAAGYCVAAILARTLGATGYGVYGVVISQVLWLELLANAGVPAVTARLVADGRHDPGVIESSARALLVSLSLLLLVFGWLVAPELSQLMRIASGTVLFRIAILDLPFAAVYASYEGILHARRQYGTVAAAHVFFAFGKLAAVLAVVGLGVSLEGALFATVVATAAVCAALIVHSPLRSFRVAPSLIRELAIAAAPVCVFLVLGQVLVNLDLWSLKSMWTGPSAVIGQYVASVNLARTLMLIPSVQAGVLFASIAWAAATGDAAQARRHICEGTRFALVLAAAACVLLGLNGADLLSVLFSPEYAPGQPFLRLLLVGFSQFALLDAFAHALMATGRRWIVAGVVVIAVPLAWLGNYLLIPRFGALGAAISMVVGVTLVTVVIGSIAYRQFGALVRWSTLTRVMIAAGIVGMVSAAISGSGPLVVVKVAMLGVLYLFVLYRLGEVTPEDFGFPRRLQSPVSVDVSRSSKPPL